MSEGEAARKKEGDGHRHREHRERIGNYVVGQEIGRGSFATVYQGRQSKSKTPVAIKAVSRQKLTSKLLDNLESEINILKAISHRNIVALTDCFKNDTHIYLVMEFCTGNDLSVYLRQRGHIETLDFVPRIYESNMVASRGGKVFWPHPPAGGLDERVTRCFLGQLAEAVRFLRTQDLIHRDIKPQNLLLQPATPSEVAEGHPLGIPILKVADFGFARVLPTAAMAETLCGSPLYMAPEILRYEKYDAKADLWSVGAVLYEMAVGRSPFRAPNHVELLRRIEKGNDRIKFPDESSSSRASDAPPLIPVSPDIKALIRGLLKQRPAQRMGFEEFFNSGVWDGFMTESIGDVTTSIDVSTDSSAVDFGMSDTRDPKSSAGSFGTAPLASPTPASPNPAVKRNASGDLSSRPSSRPSTSAPTPTPTLPHRRSEPKYYVGDEPAEPVRESLPPSPVSPVSAGAASRTTPRAISSPAVPQSRPYSTKVASSTSADDPSVVTPPTGPIAPRPVIGGSPLAATPPITMTGKDESALGASDSVGREYVVVEKRTVEINELADELEQRTRRPSNGALVRVPGARPISQLRPINSSPPPATIEPASYSPPFAMGSTPPFAVAPTIRPTAMRTRQPSLPSTPTVFPPPGSYAMSAERSSPGSLPSSNALARVLTNTAVRLLNSTSNTAANVVARATGSSARRWPQVERSGEIDPDENELLDFLEDAAHKAFVLYDLGDHRLIQWSQTSRPPPPQVSTSTATITPHTPPSPNMPPFAVPPVGMGRRKSSASSTSSDILVLRQAQEAAGDACALYFKSLAFVCAGHERFKRFWDARKNRNMEYQTSDELNELVQWFRARFNEVYEKAEWAKARSAEQLPYVDRLVHDRARDISRQSAQAELLGDLPNAEEGYETAMWLLSTLLDDVMHDGVKLRDDDRAGYERLITPLRERLDGVRRKMDAAARPSS
jgi:serine/threonine-protein kinase ULK/ATG1